MTTVDITGKNVLILGKPASGKTYLANLLKQNNNGHHFIHTDNYIKYGYEKSLYVLLSDLTAVTEPTGIEGVLGYRLLRKGAQTGVYYPDLVVVLDITDEQMVKTYLKERPGKDINAVKTYVRSNETIFANYQTIRNPHPPAIIHIKNAY
jgi:broad-specificity NMP kinase